MSISEWAGEGRRAGTLDFRRKPARPDVSESGGRRQPRTRVGSWSTLVALATGALVLGLTPQAAISQTAPAPAIPVPPAPSLVVNSTPAGATVLLHGPYELVGTTPWTVTRDLTGVYQIEVRKSGYESWHGEVVVAPGAGSSIEVDLNAKSRLRAFARSLVVPGWGQSYLGNTARGRTYLAAEVLALGGWIWTNELYQQKVDDFDRAVARYQRGYRQEELPALRRARDKAKGEADDAYDRRQLVIGAAAGVWAISLCDALFFGSGTSGGSEPVTEAAPAGTDLHLVLDAGTRGVDEARLGVALNW